MWFYYKSLKKRNKLMCSVSFFSNEKNPVSFVARHALHPTSGFLEVLHGARRAMLFAHHQPQPSVLAQMLDTRIQQPHTSPDSRQHSPR